VVTPAMFQISAAAVRPCFFSLSATRFCACMHITVRMIENMARSMSASTLRAKEVLLLLLLLLPVTRRTGTRQQLTSDRCASQAC
jgi:hypothetical protein